MGNLRPYALRAKAGEYIVHARSVLGVKPDLASRCIRRARISRFVLLAKSSVRELAVLCDWRIKMFEMYSVERFSRRGGHVTVTLVTDVNRN